jgi:hypothetical protein
MAHVEMRSEKKDKQPQPEAPPQETTLMKGLKITRNIALFMLMTPVAMLIGCGGEEIPRPKPQMPSSIHPSPTPVQPPKEAEAHYWWPGYIVANGKLADVSFGFFEGHQPADSFSTASDIPQTLRDKNRPALQSALDYVAFFMKSQVYDSMIMNNVFTYGDTGGASGIISQPFGYKVVDSQGKTFAYCFDICQTYQQIMMNPGTERVLLHELLHDVFGSIFTDDQRNAFAANARLLFNAGGNTWQDDELMGAIWSGIRHTDSADMNKFSKFGFEGFFKGPELDDWANEKLAGSGLSSYEKNSIKQAIKAYFEIREEITFGRTYGLTVPDRDGFIVGEGFAYLGARYDVTNELYDSGKGSNTRVIPYFMKKDYGIVMKEDKLSGMVNAGSGYFTSAESFKGFVTYVDSFVAYMKQRYPELESVGK